MMSWCLAVVSAGIDRVYQPGPHRVNVNWAATATWEELVTSAEHSTDGRPIIHAHCGNPTTAGAGPCRQSGLPNSVSIRVHVTESHTDGGSGHRRMAVP